MNIAPLSLKNFCLALLMPLIALAIQYYYYHDLVRPICRDCAPGTAAVFFVLTFPPALIVVLNFISLYLLQKVKLFYRFYLVMAFFSPLIFETFLLTVHDTILALRLINYSLLFLSGMTIAIAIVRGLIGWKRAKA